MHQSEVHGHLNKGQFREISKKSNEEGQVSRKW
jgi:hypothetical protein